MNDVEDLIKTIKESPIISKLYELKKKGKCPRIEVNLIEGEEIGMALLKLPGVSLYFHKTKGEKVTTRESETMSGKKLKIISIPFDGWETN